ncbi:hypothetical protein PaeCFBP13512_18360 [Paenibacillus sp. CFBP13512]|uniref:hypothetical protein n=1 Tax=Paenibacillus sp. CFBP13512 TaxID=2184007 RepID=UPI0010C1106A|nr:hypothetical protein [Paenibacillus sp. CFBP13512]TKJ87186.1 hypothetical protein PaeCFBP13512_18360 [Paenibacillus sp. CFBP13512]
MKLAKIFNSFLSISLVTVSLVGFAPSTHASASDSALTPAEYIEFLKEGAPNTYANSIAPASSDTSTPLTQFEDLSPEQQQKFVDLISDPDIMLKAIDGDSTFPEVQVNDDDTNVQVNGLTAAASTSFFPIVYNRSVQVLGITIFRGAITGQFKRDPSTKRVYAASENTWRFIITDNLNPLLQTTKPYADSHYVSTYTAGGIGNDFHGKGAFTFSFGPIKGYSIKTGICNGTSVYYADGTGHSLIATEEN